MPNFPNSKDDNDSLFLAINNGRTQLTSSIDNTTLTIPVVTTTGYPTAGFITILSDPSDITLAEAIRYDGFSETTFSGAERGAGGTTAVAHNQNDNVDFTVMAEHHNELKDAIIALETFVGISGSPEFVPKDEFGNVNISGTLTVDNLIEAGWITASGSLVVSGPADFKEDVTVSGIATFGEIPVSSFPSALGSFDDSTGTMSSAAFTTVHSTAPISAGESLVFYRGNIGFDTSSASTGSLDIRARFGTSVMAEGAAQSSVKIGHTGGAEVAGFKVITGDAVSAATIQVKLGSGANTGQYGAMGIVSVPLEQMSLVSGTDYWFTNGSDTGQTHDQSAFEDFDNTGKFFSSLNFTAPETGEYLILFGSELSAGLEGRNRFLLDGAELMTQAESGNNFKSPCPGAVIETLTAGSHILKMEQSTNIAFSSTSASQRARFFVVNTSAFDQIQGVRDAADQSISSSTSAKLNAYSQTYTPRQREQLLVIGIAGFTTTTDTTAAGYKIKNVTDGEDYSVDSGQHPFNEGSVFDDVLYRPTMMFRTLDNVLTFKDFDLYARRTNGGTITNTDGSLIIWGMSPPPGSPDVSFTTINSDNITTHQLDADIVEISQSATVSGIPVMTELSDSLVFTDITVTGTATVENLDAVHFTTTSGAVSDSLTVSGIPVSTDSGVTEINSITGSVTAAGAGSVTITEDGQIMTVSGEQASVSDPLVLSSGIYSDSLTISGTPVSTGTSGGAALTVKETDGVPTVSNVNTIVVTTGTLTDDGGGQVTITTGGGGGGGGTLQDAYDSGDGTITTAGGKPLELDGTGELTAVTGTFTDGITIGTASTAIDDKSIITASGIFSDTITLQGIPLSPGSSAGFRGAKVASSSGIDVDSGAIAFNGDGTLSFDTVHFDTDGFFDTAQEGRFVIPAGINKVRVSYGGSFPTGSTGDRTFFISKNGATVGSWRGAPNLTSDLRQQAITPVLDVVEGDIFTPGVLHTQGTTLTLGSSASPDTFIHFSLEVIDPVASTPNDISSISGTFTQNLNLPGLPTSSGSLNAGDVWVDISAGHTLKVTPD